MTAETPAYDRRRSASKDALVEKKRHQSQVHATDGIPNGLVEIPGPIPPSLAEELENIARNCEERARERRPHARILSIAPFQDGMAIETEGEKLAQQIANAIGKSRKAKVERTYDDAGKRRILTCILEH
jgi:hypothetical protein